MYFTDEFENISITVTNAYLIWSMDALFFHLNADLDRICPICLQPTACLGIWQEEERDGLCINKWDNLEQLSCT